MLPATRTTIEQATGAPVVATEPLGHGHGSVLSVATLSDGRRVVAKEGMEGGRLALEGFMLDHLRRHGGVPVPTVHHAQDRLLVMDFVDGGPPTPAAETHAAELIAALHAVGADRYGFERDTLIGPLPQPNPPSDDWIAFFRDRRLMFMARAAFEEKAIDADMFATIERVAERLEDLIGTPSPPALIHGDLWDGNIRAVGTRITGFIDPAIYHADPEIELAFATLFGTFGETFFRRYQEIRPLRPGFFECRRDLYTLYPLLVHARLFGGGYVGQVASIARRFAG